jgi:hypothetical protein
MFDDLLQITVEEESSAGLTRLGDATPEAMLEAQVATADMFDDLGVPSDEELDARMQRHSAREAFVAINFDANDDDKKVALAKLKAPAAVQHLVGMLTEYDWEFINQARELRGYTVAKIVEHTKNSDPKVSLKALQMLGNVTEVKLFTERVEVIRKDANEEELEAKLRERLAKFLAPTLVADESGLVDEGVIDIKPKGPPGD